MSSHLLSTAKWYTSPILHSVLATKTGQAPAESYTKCMKHIPAKATISISKSYTWKYPAVTQSSCGAKGSTIWSCTAYITATPQQLSFEPGYVLQVGLTLLWNLFRFFSFFVTVDTNVNELLLLESVTSAVPRITWWNSLGLLLPFLHTASDQKLEA